MRHTTFENELRDIRRRAINELRSALEAHGGKYDFTKYDSVPFVRGEAVCEARLYDGEVFVDTTESFLATNDNYLTIEEILELTDYIAETEEVKDVSGVYPVPVTWVDCDDIEGQGFDTDGLTQSDLEGIANHMAGTYLGYSFSEDLRLACEEYGLEQKEEED